MTPAQEHVLYLRDREAWARHVAPRWAHILKTVDAAERARTWALACPELKRAIRALATVAIERDDSGDLFGVREAAAA